MSRLTKTNISTAINMLSYPQTCDTEDFDMAYGYAIKALKELQHYKYLEEQGRLIELPCAVGDTVYGYWIDGKKSAVYDYEPPNEPACILVKDCWGKRFFATKEEAEAKLAELGGKA